MKGKELGNDTGVGGVLQTSSEEGTSVTSLRGAGGGFTQEVASEPWFSFLLRAFYIQEVVFANRYILNSF